MMGQGAKDTGNDPRPALTPCPKCEEPLPVVHCTSAGCTWRRCVMHGSRQWVYDTWFPDRGFWKDAR